MNPANLVVDVWAGARAGALRFGADVDRANDLAQSAVLVALQVLAKGRTVRNPRAFGRRVARNAWTRERQRAALFVAFEDGMGWGVQADAQA